MTAHTRSSSALGLVSVALALVALACGTVPASAHADFGIVPGSFRFQALNPDGSTDVRAGSHPDSLATSFEFNLTTDSEGGTIPDGSPRNIEVQLPPGTVGDAAGFETCTQEQLFFNTCPTSSQLGVAHLREITESGVSPALFSFRVYNMVPPPGVAAQFAFFAITARVYMNASVRTGDDYGVNITLSEVSQALSLAGSSVTLWGVPADPSHDGERGSCLGLLGPSGELCPAGVPRRPFLRLPTSCSGPTTTLLSMERWEPFEPRRAEASYLGSDEEGNPLPMSSCDGPPFDPSLDASLERQEASTPSGLDITVRVPQETSEAPDGVAEADLKDATVALPAGVAVDPASANGLQGCSSAQLALHTSAPADCPAASAIGTVHVDTPLLDHELEGHVYVATPFDNPFGTLLAIYVAVDDRESGVVLKLAGRVDADPRTGQLTTTFSENPQLPFETLRFDFFGGPRAALRTPDVCGGTTVTASMTPWTAPAGSASFPTAPLAITRGANGGRCVSAPGEEPDARSFEAGTSTPAAATYSPFVFDLAREDGSQQLGSIEATLPEGLLANLSGIPYCTEAEITAIEQSSGRNEQANPACPAASQVGTVTVSAGAGPLPLRVPGKAYLAGPYKGAPLSLVVAVPAVAGPFDLGTVAVRNALYVDPGTTQARVISDRFPEILQGIPLDVREVKVTLDKPRFTLNPTSCPPTAIGASVTSVLGQTASLSAPFQAANCGALPFRPKLALRVFGKTARNAKPRFRAVLTAEPGEANIARAQVNLPHSEFLEQNHIKTVCTRVQFAAGGGHGEQCPKGSIYGHARALTPLLDKPLEGPVYLRSSSHKLPDLVAALNGQIDVALDGRIDTGKGGGIRNTFEVVPDAPVTKFVLSMPGGKKGLLVNSENICRKPQRATVKLDAQNGKVHDFNPVVRNSCKKRNSKRHHSRASLRHLSKVR